MAMAPAVTSKLFLAPSRRKVERASNFFCVFDNHFSIEPAAVRSPTRFHSESVRQGLLFPFPLSRHYIFLLKLRRTVTKMIFDDMGARTEGQVAPISLEESARRVRWLKCLPSSWNLGGPLLLRYTLGTDVSLRMGFLKNISSKSNMFATSVLVVCLSPPAIPDWKHKVSDDGTIALLLLYTVDKQGNICLLGSARFLFTPSSPESSPPRLTSAWDSQIPFHARPRQHVLRVVFSIFLERSKYIPSGNKHSPLFLCYYTFETVQSIFGFLKYAGPRRLRSSRKVLLDEDGYQITHIGQGAFAVISRVLYRPTGDVRVMKRITFDDSGLAKYLAKNEVDTLKAMAGNTWFPQLLNDFEEGRQFVVTMPFYRRGDLASFMQHKRHLGREVAQFYSAQLVLAIQSLHKVGIIHRDIKPDNIFLDEDGHLVLADFGLAENIATHEGGEEAMLQFPLWLEAKTKNDEDFPFLWVNRHNPLSMRGVAGTFWYTAPEVFRKERYSFGVDYWSVGVIYHELITGHIPFNHFKHYPENKCPELDFRRKPGQVKDIVSWEEKALSQLLSPYPTDRPKTLKDIKNSRIFRDVDWISMSQKRIPPPSLPPPLLEDGYPYPYPAPRRP